MAIRKLDDIDVAGKRTLVRVDFNVPLRDGAISDPTRILAALPTIRYLIEADARVILMSHLGRPKGEVKPEFTLEPVAARLAELLDRDVIFTDDCVGYGVRKLASEIRDGELMLLENLRFHKGETSNDASFAERLAAP
ncbi:MAG: phosphoglycerate kinase, partial [Myxococcota bacterium]|nr:phosphoglycerate kinase [Myxococcota bacterium]